MNRDFGNARIKYQEALKIKPDARYPKDMIMKAEQGEAQTRSETERYDATVASADVFYKSGDLEAALTGYRTALELKPGADYPSKKITEIEKSIFETNSRQEAFQLAIRNGDQAFSENNWEVALKHYKDALTLKPDEQYPKDRIKAIETILADNKARDEAYSSAIEDGDAMFEQKLYDKAIESYEGALSVKPGEKYPTEQITEARRKISERETNQKNYDNSIASGEQQFQSGKFEEALLSFKAASLLKPGDPYPASRISEIQKKLAEIKVRDDSYSRAIADGDLFFNQKKYREALEPYERASTIKPEESYPKAQKEQIFKLLDDQKKLDDEFNQLIANGEKLFNDKQFLPSLDIFKQAQKLKPLEQIPQEKIVAIQSILEEIRVREEAASQALALEKEKQDRLYTDAITEGDQLLASQNFIDAKRAYIRASELKPTENYPKDKLKEINLVLESQAKAVKEEYDKAITDADKLYLQKILDQAVEAYESAASIKPDENYPFEMIRKIKQYIADHSILEVNTVTVIIPSGDEKKFNFRGIEPRLRNNNYVMIRARALGTTVPKVYFNYGRDNAKNGGIVLRTISTREGVDYLIRLAGQDKWYREDNNWLSLYTEGCDLEVSRIEISQGD